MTADSHSVSDARNEFRRVLFGPWQWENPAGFAVMRAQVLCSGSPRLLLERARGTLAVILAAQEIVQASDTFLSMDDLSGWFCTAVSPDTDCDRATYYLDWFNSGRDWRWRGARVVEPERIDVYLDILGFPVSGFDCLRWLFKRCGALEVDQGPSVDPAEVAG